MKDIKFIPIITIYFIAVITNAQVTFQKTWGTDGEDKGYDVEQTNDGDYIIVGKEPGYSWEGLIENTDALLFKINDSGRVIAMNNFGSMSDLNEEAYCIKNTVDNKFSITGFGEWYDTLSIFLVKINENLDIIWENFYFDSAKNTMGYSVIETKDSGYVVAGAVGNPLDLFNSLYTLKTNAEGKLLWTKQFNDDYFFYEVKGYDVLQTYDGGFIFVENHDCIVLRKTNSSGDSLWVKKYYEYRKVKSIEHTKDSNYIITGCDTTGNIFLIKTDTSGNIIWSKNYGGRQYDYGKAVQQTTDGGYIIAGGTNSYGAGDTDVYLIKTDENGDTLWTRTFGGDSTDYAESVRQTKDGGFIVVGATKSYGAGDYDAYLIKTDSTGYAAPYTGIKEKQYNTNNISIYPNPTSSSFNIQLHDTPYTVQIKIYTISGTLIYSKHHNTQNIAIDLSNHNKGIYLVKIITSNQCFHKKVIVQ